MMVILRVSARRSALPLTTRIGRLAFSPSSPFSSSPQSPSLPVTFEDVSKASFLIKSGVQYTPCDFSHALSEICNTNVYLKKDFMQFTGSFKERGARYALLSLSSEEKENGVVFASAGNHALAMAWHGKNLGIPVTCVMPTTAPFTKFDRCRKFGANVILHGNHIGEAKEYAMENFSNLKYVNGYDDPEICAGAGSLGIEVLDQLNKCDVVLVPVGGCGLIAGVSLAVKTLSPQTKVIGIEPENCPSFTAALKKGEPVYAFKNGSLADGLAVPMVGPTSFSVARCYTDSTELVTEKMIAIAMLRLIEMEKLVVEGGGAAALASILPGGPLYGMFEGKNVVIPLCGGNIDTTTLGRVIDRGLAADGRLVRFNCTISDRPGGIAAMTKILWDANVSVKDITHERAWLSSQVDQVVLKVVVETSGSEHTRDLFVRLEKEGYEVLQHPLM